MRYYRLYDMTMPDLDHILQILPNLSDSDRSTIKARLQALATLGIISPAKPAEAHEILLAICRYLTDAGLEHPGLLGLMGAAQYKPFLAKCDAIMTYLGDLNKVERASLLQIGIDLLYKNLREMGIVVSARTLMSHIHRLPACLNRAFPGYVQAGYLHMIVRGKK